MALESAVRIHWFRVEGRTIGVKKKSMRIQKCPDVAFNGRGAERAGDEVGKDRPFLSSKISHFQNGAECKTFLVKISFVCMRIKNHFGWALNRALKQTRLAHCCHGNFVISNVKSNIIAEISRQNKRRCVTKFIGTRSVGTATKLNETCTRSPCTRVTVFLRIRLFLERFWRKFRISFKSHKTVKKKPTGLKMIICAS